MKVKDYDDVFSGSLWGRFFRGGYRLNSATVWLLPPAGRCGTVDCCRQHRVTIVRGWFYKGRCSDLAMDELCVLAKFSTPPCLEAYPRTEPWEMAALRRCMSRGRGFGAFRLHQCALSRKVRGHGPFEPSFWAVAVWPPQILGVNRKRFAKGSGPRAGFLDRRARPGQGLGNVAPPSAHSTNLGTWRQIGGRSHQGRMVFAHSSDRCLRGSVCNSISTGLRARG